MTTFTGQGRSLVQTLAIQSQIHLAGTVGRVLKQIRDIEQVAPLFVDAGLVHPVKRELALNARVAGISSRATTAKTIGGYLYAAAAVRMDLAAEDNVISTIGQDSTCELDDIDYEDQSKRLQLINVRQAYEMADAALRSSDRFDLVMLDCPLVLNRSMVPLREDESDAAFRQAFMAATDAITNFWKNHRDRLLPWNPNGTAVLGLASQRFGAIVYVARQDLRTEAGRQQILDTEGVDETRIQAISKLSKSISELVNVALYTEF